MKEIIMKKCFKCLMVKNVLEFYRHKMMSDGFLGKCMDCTKNDVRKRRIVAREYYNDFDRRRYRENIQRMLKLKYICMRRRIMGLTAHSGLVGKDIMSLDDFMDWCDATRERFMEIYNNWKKSGYKRAESPSVDRIDNSIGYVAGNLQWLSQRENSKKWKF